MREKLFCKVRRTPITVCSILPWNYRFYIAENAFIGSGIAEPTKLFHQSFYHFFDKKYVREKGKDLLAKKLTHCGFGTGLLNMLFLMVIYVSMIS